MFCTKVLLVTLAQFATIKASLDPNHNYYTYSLNREISVDLSLENFSIEDDGSSTVLPCNGKSQDQMNMHISNKAPVSLFFHGGDMIDTMAAPTHSAGSPSLEPFVAMAECAFMPRSQAEMEFDYEYDEDEEEDDDEDDDQDDGHSSMLSNSSIRKRVAVSATGDDSSGQPKSQYTSSRSTSNYSHFNARGYNLKSKQSNGRKHDPLLLNVRGGAQMSDEFAKRLVTAAVVTLMYEGALGHILEFLKIAMQTAEPGTTYTSIIKSITSEKGIGGLWDGFIPWGVIQSIFKGGVFGLAHAVAKAQLTPLSDEGAIPEIVALTLAGGIAGGFQGFVLSPTLLLKTRVMTNPVFRERMSLWRTTMLSFAIGLDVVKNEGVGALMKGSNIFALKRVFDWSTRFFFSDAFETMMLSYGFGGASGVLSPKEKIIASLLGGTASTIVTLPLDVIVAKSQDAKKAGVKVSAWETFMKDYKEGGWKGLYNANMMGFEARLAHVCFTTVVMKTGSGLMFNYLFGDK